MSTRPVDTRRIEEIGEKIVVKDSSADVEAIQDILMEMADMRYPVYPSLRSIKWYWNRMIYQLIYMHGYRQSAQ